MRSILLSLWITTGFLFAQPSSRFLLNRIRYIPENTSSQQEPLLNSNYQLSRLDPLPELQLPSELPMVFHPEPDMRIVASLFEEAGQALSTGESATAVTLMEEALALYPDLLIVRIRYADSLLSNQNLKEAKRVYEEILRDHPTNFQCLNNLAWLLATQESTEYFDPKRALSLATRARIMNPNSHHVWSTLAEAQFRLGMYPEAEQSMVFALELANASGAQVNILVNYLMKRDRYSLAREATSLLQ